MDYPNKELPKRDSVCEKKRAYIQQGQRESGDRAALVRFAF